MEHERIVPLSAAVSGLSMISIFDWHAMVGVRNWAYS